MDPQNLDQLEPADLNYEFLPDQHGYTVDVEAADAFKIDSMTSRTAIFTNDFRVNMLEGYPGDGLDWHTHMPNIEQTNFCLEGHLRAYLEREDGDIQILEIGPGELMYLPGGARHALEVIGEGRHRHLNIFTPDAVGRTEQLRKDIDPPYATKENWPVALWVDRQRNEVVRKNGDAVGEGRVVSREEAGLE
ncbi:MAG: cupin domain-containing protein [Salinirussus sp.]